MPVVSSRLFLVWFKLNTPSFKDAVAGTVATPAAASKKPAGKQQTQDEAIAELSKFDFGLTLEQYRQLCNKEPTNRLACDPNWRSLNQQDYQALLKAKSMGVTLLLPFIPNAPHGDYAVGDPFSIIPSGLPRQLAALIALKSGVATGDDGAAAQAAADQAKAKAGQDAAAAAQAKAKADQDAAAAAQAKAKADQDAAALAQKKAADDAAAAKAAGDAQAAAAAQAAADKAAAEAAAAKAAQEKAAAEAAAAKLAQDKAAADAAAVGTRPSFVLLASLLRYAFRPRPRLMLQPPPPPLQRRTSLGSSELADLCKLPQTVTRCTLCKARPRRPFRAPLDAPVSGRPPTLRGPMMHPRALVPALESSALTDSSSFNVTESRCTRL